MEEETRTQKLYSLIKTILLGNGIPCQVIRSVTISTTNEQPEIVLGMSRAMDKYKKLIVGFVTIFKHNGDFILFLFKITSDDMGRISKRFRKVSL